MQNNLFHVDFCYKDLCIKTNGQNAKFMVLCLFVVLFLLNPNSALKNLKVKAYNSFGSVIYSL